VDELKYLNWAEYTTRLPRREERSQEAVIGSLASRTGGLDPPEKGRSEDIPSTPGAAFSSVTPGGYKSQTEAVPSVDQRERRNRIRSCLACSDKFSKLLITTLASLPGL
jgi:hypothetical protein